jgi:hypothetical protein
MNNLDLSGLEGIGNMLSKVTGKKWINYIIF